MAHARTLLALPRSIPTLLFGLTLTIAGPALAEDGADPRSADSATDSAVHATIESAAMDAIAAMRVDRSPTTRGRFRAGRILAVDGGFVWERPSIPSRGERHVVRLQSTPGHVATFLARPRHVTLPDRRVVREWQRRERALVEVGDRQHRPLFVLTGTGDVVVYRQDKEPREFTELAARE